MAKVKRLLFDRLGSICFRSFGSPRFIDLVDHIAGSSFCICWYSIGSFFAFFMNVFVFMHLDLTYIRDFGICHETPTHHSELMKTALSTFFSLIPGWFVINLLINNCWFESIFVFHGPIAFFDFCLSLYCHSEHKFFCSYIEWNHLKSICL